MMRKRTVVEWSWGKNKARGKITEIFTDNVTRTIKGTRVTRKASPDAPAYLIEQDDGDRVLKARSEVSRAD